MVLKLLLIICFVAIVTGQWVKQMENDGLYEGDMLLTPDQLTAARVGKLGYATTNKNHWPTTIYYDWAPERANINGILAAIAEYENETCLRFHKRTNQKDYMYFFSGGGCYSGVGFNGGGRRKISIGVGCTRKGTVIHEIAHRLGIYHEQSRPDRDNYITVMFANIYDSMQYNFKKQSTSNIDSLGTPYDLLSIMHYPDWAFSKNGKPTILTKDPNYQKKIGQRSGLSVIDKEQINKMYCTTKKTDGSFALKHGNGKCLSINSANQIVFSNSCSTRFVLVNGKLSAKGSSKCAQAESNVNGAWINVVDNCNHTFKIVFKEYNGRFALQNIQTGKCIHQQSGRIVIFSGCNEKRLKFWKI